jgi:hypothetical protein
VNRARNDDNFLQKQKERMWKKREGDKKLVKKEKQSWEEGRMRIRMSMSGCMKVRTPNRRFAELQL